MNAKRSSPSVHRFAAALNHIERRRPGQAAQLRRTAAEIIHVGQGGQPWTAVGRAYAAIKADPIRNLGADAGVERLALLAEGRGSREMRGLAKQLRSFHSHAGLSRLVKFIRQVRGPEDRTFDAMALALPPPR